MQTTPETEAKSDRNKPKRKAVVPLFRLDKRTRLGRRVAELESIYTEAIGSDLSPLQREQVAQAAQWTAACELARAAFTEGRGDADAMVRCENAMRRSIKALGIRDPGPKTPSLHEYLAQKAKAKEAAQ